MSRPTTEAILIIDTFPTLPVRSIRYRKRIRNYYRLGQTGAVPAATTWRVPTRLWNALDRFSGPDHVPAWRLDGLREPIQSSYGSIPFDNVGHGSTVFSLLADTNPHQPLVIMDSIDLFRIDPVDYCDASGSVAVQNRLLQASQAAAGQIIRVMRDNNVRFVNFSAGHTLPVVTADWRRDCGTQPSDAVLRQKLAAYAPIYDALFRTVGVMTIQAAIEGADAADFPYDQPSPAWPNRLRTGYFTSLNSGVDSQGRGDHAGLTGWPGAANADIYVNTGVLPTRPYAYNFTPLLQIGEFGIDHFPITAPQTSWVTPLALSRLINLRYGTFANRTMDDSLIADLFRSVTPTSCPGLPGSRCVYQDPLLHGDIESVRLEYRSKFYS